MRSVLTLLTVFLQVALHAVDTDVVTFANGNMLIGEIKLLDRGKLHFETEATGVVQIEWDKVTSLLSDQNLQLETFRGNRHIGSLKKEDSSGTLLVSNTKRSAELPLDDVVYMRPIEIKTKDRFDVYIRLGATYDKASEVAQFNLGLDLAYLTEKREFNLELDSFVTDNNDETTQRQDLELNYRALRKNRWFSGGLFKLQKNEELGINRRTSIGGGVGRTLKESTQNRLELSGGLMVSREDSVGISGTETNVEGLVTMNYDWYRFNTPELDIKSSLSLFPGITDSGRLRGEFDLRFRWEMIEDLFWETSFYNNYDNNAENKFDYGVVTSLGYKF
jgi:hypothetical protein